MARTPTKAPADPADPLAHLREPEAPAGVAPDGPADEPDQPEPLRYTQAWHERMMGEVVTAYHGDTVAKGALHAGGVCPCRHLARLALRTAVGEPVEAVLEGDGGTDE